LQKVGQFYITARYPNGLPSGIPQEYFEKDEAEEAIKLASEVLRFIESLINECR